MLGVYRIGVICVPGSKRDTGVTLASGEIHSKPPRSRNGVANAEQRERLVCRLCVARAGVGAGKTMVVTALGMLLGRRADAGAVRVGAEKAVAEAVVNVPSDHAAVALVEDAGGDVDHEQDRASLQLSRS